MVWNIWGFHVNCIDNNQDSTVNTSALMEAFMGKYEGTPFAMLKLPGVERTCKTIDNANLLLFKNAKKTETIGSLPIS